MKVLVGILGLLIVLATFYGAVSWMVNYIITNYPEAVKYVLSIVKGFKDGNFESITQAILDEFTNSTRGDVDG